MPKAIAIVWSWHSASLELIEFSWHCHRGCVKRLLPKSASCGNGQIVIASSKESGTAHCRGTHVFPLGTCALGFVSPRIVVHGCICLRESPLSARRALARLSFDLVQCNLSLVRCSMVDQTRLGFLPADCFIVGSFACRRSSLVACIFAFQECGRCIMRSPSMSDTWCAHSLCHRVCGARTHAIV